MKLLYISVSVPLLILWAVHVAYADVSTSTDVQVHSSGDGQAHSNVKVSTNGDEVQVKSESKDGETTQEVYHNGSKVDVPHDGEVKLDNNTTIKTQMHDITSSHVEIHSNASGTPSPTDAPSPSPTQTPTDTVTPEATPTPTPEVSHEVDQEEQQRLFGLFPVTIHVTVTVSNETGEVIHTQKSFWDTIITLFST